jgi:Mce-associated membrane protein
VSPVTEAVSPYDLLDVAPDASPEEIRAAWKSAIADLEPGDRRFRAYNQAAELLLDPDRRATYDASVALPLVEEGAPRPSRNHGESEAHEDTSAGVDTVVSASPSTSGDTARAVPGWLLVGLALLTAGAVGLASWLWFAVPSDASVEESTRNAQAAAERAIVPVLSYDAATLEEDQAAAASYLTPSYREDYDRLFEVIKQNAAGTGTKVTAEVVASGIVRSGAERVDVLVFVNRPTTNKRQKEPVVYRDQVTITMQKVGDSWLVDGLVTSPPAQ